MMGDLPEWKGEKVVSLLWVTYPGKKNGLIVMGDLTKEKKEKKKSGLILWVTYPRIKYLKVISTASFGVDENF